MGKQQWTGKKIKQSKNTAEKIYKNKNSKKARTPAPHNPEKETEEGKYGVRFASVEEAVNGFGLLSLYAPCWAAHALSLSLWFLFLVCFEFLFYFVFS